MRSFADMLLYINESQDKNLSDSKMKKLNLLEQVYISSLMKNALKEAFKDENTITKLESEERENDNMKENTNIMNIFEACEYVREHTDKYLVQRHNDRFTLHSDGKRVYTKFKKDDGGILEQTVELNNAMMCSEWVKVEKLYPYLFILRYKGECIFFTTKNCNSYAGACLYAKELSESFTLKIDKEFYYKHLESESLVEVDAFALYDVREKELVRSSIKA